MIFEAVPNKGQNAREIRLDGVGQFYPRGLRALPLSQKSISISDSVELNAGTKLHVNKNIAWISRGDVKVGDFLFGETGDRSLLTYEGKTLPNSLMKTGPNEWLFAGYEAKQHQIMVYGLAVGADKIKWKRLFRVRLFAEGLTSAPFLSYGPSIIYHGVNGQLYCYFFDTLGSGDVEPIIFDGAHGRRIVDRRGDHQDWRAHLPNRLWPALNYAVQLRRVLRLCSQTRGWRSFGYRVTGDGFTCSGKA